MGDGLLAVFDRPAKAVRCTGAMAATARAMELLVEGSGIELEDAGEHELKGLPGVRRVFQLAR